MPDNTILNPGAGGDTARSVQKGGAAGPKSQSVVIDRGGSGTEDLSPLDGTDITTPTAMPAGGVGIRGWLSAIWTKLNGTVVVSGPLTDGQLRAAAVPVSLASTTVTGSVAVTGPLTDTQLRAAAVPVSGSVTVNNPTAQGLTDAQLRAAAVPISAASLPLPAGAATETTLAALNTKVTAVNTGAVVLAAGAAIAGKFGIDQTTPGTTNLVALTAETTKVIGAVSVSAPLKATYSASVNALAPALTPTDIFTITGSATRTIKIHSIQIDATATAAAVVAVFLVKRSTANTVGTSTAPARVPLDSASAAATGTVLAYTANPTTGTLVGNVRSEKLLVSTTTSSGETLLINFGDALGSPIVLRGIAEVLGINLNAVTLAGGSVNLFVEWTEE